MRFIDQRLNLVPSHTRYRDLQLYLYAETCRNWAYAHGSLNVGLGRQSHFFTGCHQFKGPQKTCRVTGCEQLLGIRSFSSGAAQLFRGNKLDIKDAVRRHSPTIAARSEEHPSELQSLMRISYAVFCLKKKNQS